MTPDQVETWIRLWWLFGGLATALAFYAAYKVQYDLPKQLRIAEERAEQNLISKGPYHWPNRVFESDPNWTEVDYINHSNYRLFVANPSIPINESRATQIVLRDGEQTVLFAEKHVLGSRYRWISSQHGEISNTPIQSGDFQVSVRQAVEGTALARVVREADLEDEVDIIGIGLESHTGNDVDPRRQLSRRRGRDLAVAAQALIDTVSSEQEPSYRALGLGKARTPATSGTPEEQNQRRLVVFVSARKRNALNQAQAIETLISGVPHYDIDLTDYEYSMCVSEVLSPQINFKGGGSSDWFDSGPTVDELC